MTTVTRPTPKEREAPSKDYCHLQAIKRDPQGNVLWKLDRPLCGATDGTRCVAGATRHYTGYRRCPDCGRRICPACIAQDRAR